MAKGGATPKAKGGASQAVAPAKPESLQERRALAGQLLARLLRLRNAPVEVDDTPQPKYTEAGPVSKERLKENAKLRKEAGESGMIKFLLKSEERTRRQQAEAQRRYAEPFHKEDRALWKKLPPVPGPFGEGKLVRKGLAGQEEKAAGVFLDFFRNFHFGLWGYQQRPYPPQKPFDIQQVIGTKTLEKRYYDLAMKGGPWYYKDRLGRTRGPAMIVNLKTAWAAGIIDKNTFVWGEDMDEFAPIGMVYGLSRAIATPDIRLAALGTGLAYRLGTFRNPFAAFKGHEKKSLEQLQAEALRDKERERAIMGNAPGQFWPGMKPPSHALFLWAGGSELTKHLDRGRKTMPDKFIPYETRKRLAKAIPGLRPWEVLEVEQVFNYLTFRDEFWRSPLGTYTTPLGYRDDLKETEAEEWGDIKDALDAVFPELNQY